MLANKTEAELRQFAVDYYHGKIFTSDMVSNPNELGMIFMPIVLGCFKGIPKEELKDYWVIYEYYDKGIPRGYNGKPIFYSLHVMNKHDADLCNIYLEEYKALQDKFNPATP
jgi:hypothetical protein